MHGDVKRGSKTLSAGRNLYVRRSAKRLDAAYDRRLFDRVWQGGRRRDEESLSERITIKKKKHERPERAGSEKRFLMKGPLKTPVLGKRGALRRSNLVPLRF